MWNKMRSPASAETDVLFVCLCLEAPGSPRPQASWVFQAVKLIDVCTEGTSSFYFTTLIKKIDKIVAISHTFL